MTTSLRSSGFRESRARRVLIVDDHIESVAALRTLLESHGHTVRVAASAREAIAGVSSFSPHVALVDVGLPDASGLDLVKVLREQPSLEHCRFVAGIGTPPSGFAAHVTKPQNWEELLELIDDSGDRESAAV